jgi:osmotically inducible protein OsmC
LLFYKLTPIVSTDKILSGEVIMERTGSAHWQGTLKEGKGNVSTESKTLNKMAYGFNSRFEEGQGTNPEELIGAAHAGCFSMAFAGQLEKAGFQVTEIDTTATVTLEKQDAGFAITTIYLDVKANVPEISKADFEKIAQNAKENCPVSKLMRAKITMECELKNNKE